LIEVENTSNWNLDIYQIIEVLGNYALWSFLYTLLASEGKKPYLGYFMGHMETV